ncbi:response regulator [Anaeromyxobacter sp. PSR-1]|uniref:hybrid sensor histidine kinase/response regulator n=1 Tax=unclassified Anaeromyxobacter TaxID=2620896 RepID=UPI0005DD1A11|nr:response regulator [Anaeromyxobacter sp. PSR-1]GAO01165.1 gliding motility regulatory protein [Anaeromyxobacter sp. PSR-1]
MDEAVMDALVATFSREAEELGAQLTRALLVVEKPEQGTDALGAAHAELRRGLHRLKGSAATVGLAELSDLAHEMEEQLAPHARDTALPRSLVDAFLAALDQGLEWMRRRAAHRADRPDLARVVRSLRGGAPAEAGGGGAGPAGPAPSAAGAEPEVGGWRVDARDVASLVADVERLREIALRLEDQGREAARILSLLPKGLAPDVADALRGALLAARAALSGDAAELGARVEAMEEWLKAVCTLPCETVIEPLHRTVRDLARQLGKEAKVSAVGVEVALDRRILEALRAPLVQLVRNAVDHGIEAPHVREQAGKHREGIVAIRVEQAGNEVLLEISDDGAGLDGERIRATAVSRGVVGVEEAARLDERQLAALVFRSGFSTRAAATGVSGRGVGLDVVADAVKSIHGRIEIHSVRGHGTRFVLSVPAELGSSPLTLVGVGDQVFGIPMHAVRKALRAEATRIRAGHFGLQLEDDGALLPLEDLGGLLGLRQPLAPGDGQPVLVVSAEGRETALAVDSTPGDRWPVVRPLPDELRHLEPYLGAATLSRGEPLLVLRPSWLLERRSAAPAAGAGPSVLVVDDSLTARAAHRAVLESAGYAAHAAASAAQALEHLRRGAYHAIVCDVDLGEGMDGIALTALIRGRPELEAVPVVLVSSHDEDAARRRAREAGADAFVSKADCAAGMLLAEIDGAMARRRRRA